MASTASNSSGSSSTIPTPALSEATESFEAKPYRYHSLPPGRYIRLLKLLPNSTHDADVVCELRAWDLDSPKCPTYTAISYTWGTSAPRSSISLLQQVDADGGHVESVAMLPVRDNIVDILRHLRQKRTTRWLWIDALCIDQTSNDERRHQVQLMGSLYREANRVIAWLGPSEAGGDTRAIVHSAFDLLEKKGLWNHAYEREYVDGRRKKFIKFCMLRYWTRKWIIQEIIEAKSVVLQEGHRTLPMSVVQAFFNNLSEISPLKLDDDISLKNVDTESHGYERLLMASPPARLALHRLSRHSCEAPINSLHKLLARYKDHHCAEPWDHVYALYNMIGSHNSHLGIDYAQTREDLYRSTIRFLRDHDEVPREDWASTTSLLLRLLKLDINAVMQETIEPLAPQDALIPMTLRRHKNLKLLEEFKQSEAFRLRCFSLNHMVRWTMIGDAAGEYRSASDGTWKAVPDDEIVGPQDLVHFRVADTNLLGLATCRIQQSDELWQVDSSKLDFIVRVVRGNRAELVGRAFTYTPRGQETLPEHSPVTLWMTTDESIVLGYWAEGLDVLNRG